MSDEKEKYRLHLVKKQAALMTKISMQQKEYDEIEKELNRSGKKKKSKKSKKDKQDDEGGCSIM